MELFSTLPKELVHHIVSYDKHFKVRKGKIRSVIPHDDPRRLVLTDIPRIDEIGHVMLVDNPQYELHAAVDSSGAYVRWTMYKYYKNVDDTDEEESLMDGVVFSMERYRTPLSTPANLVSTSDSE